MLQTPVQRDPKMGTRAVLNDEEYAQRMRQVKAYAAIETAGGPDRVPISSAWMEPGKGTRLIAIRFNPRGAGPESFKRLQAGERNGEVWEWHTASGWQKVPGSESSGANGIESSDDGRTLYVAEWGTRSVFRLSRGQATPARDEVKLDFNVDNIRWAADGTLLATGQDLAKALFVVARIDPKTLAVREVLRQLNTPAFGNGTVAVEAGKELWVGTFRGDRLAIFPLPK
jgi:hypothetical protein